MESLQDEILSIKYEIWHIDKLIPYDRNPRKNDHVVDEMAGRIKEFGCPVPLCVRPDGLIVDGHLRYKALKKLGIEQVPVAVNDSWTPAKVKAYRLSVNVMAEKADWDLGYLGLELEDLQGFDYDLSLIGFDQDQLSEILNPKILNEGLCDPDDVPEIKQDPITKLGDVWILGEHRLMCGDSTMIDHVEKLIDGKKIDMVYCDPPYGINLETDYKKRYGHDKSSTSSQFYGEDKGIDLKDILNNPFSLQAKELFVWGADNYPDCLPRGGSWTVWDKSVEAVDGIASDFELCWSRERHHYSMIRKLWKGAKAREETGQEGSHRTRWGHPTQKPIELATYFFDKWGKKSINVLEYFGGSGTTLIACEKTNRKCFMMEISPNYCDVIVKRWEKFTGKQSVLESNGKTFNELQALS